MGIVKKSVLDAPSGKVGPVIYYSAYGKNYVRSMPERYKDKKSPAQLAQRKKMQLITNFMNRFPKLFAKTFTLEAQGRSAYHAAKSYNMKHGFTGNYPEIHLNKAQLLISQGEIPCPKNVALRKNHSAIELTWDNSCTENNDLKTDMLLLAISQDQWSTYEFTNTQRSAGGFSWPANGALSLDKEIDLWLAFYRPMTNEVSNSIYCNN